MAGPINFSKPIDHDVVKGKIALITGGASGIGAATAKALALAGATVTLADINADAGEKYAAELVKQGLKVDFAHADITSWSSQVAAFKQCISHSPTKTVDIVLCCAGIGGDSILQEPTFNASVNEGDDPLPPSTRVIDVNLTGSYYTAALALHYFRPKTTTAAANTTNAADKVLIFTSSNLAYYPIPLQSTYLASKMGVRGIWKSLRDDRQLTHMRTNLFAPHIVRTPMTAHLAPILDAQGMVMVELDDVVEVLMRMVCDGEIAGRAVALHPGKQVFDLEDDVQGHFGGKAMAERREEVAPVMDFMAMAMRNR